MRFALLSSDLVGALGQPHSAVRFLRALAEAERFDLRDIEEEVHKQEEPKQTVSQMEMHINSWIMGSNKVFEEKGRGRG